ncbi:MAG: nucleotide exchange factor GrpE [Candidatus Micrarchaeota archaeon]
MPEDQIEKNAENMEEREDFHKSYLESKKNCDELLTRLKYLQADCENLKKRGAKEKIETMLYANESIISDLLRILDEFEAALQKMKDGDEKNGIKLIQSNLLALLKENGLKDIQIVENSAFDPELHEAIEQEKNEDGKLGGKIAMVLQRGYLLNGKVLRYAKVKVFGKPDKKDEEKK